MPFEPVGQNRIHPRFPIRSRRAKPSDHVCRQVDRNPLFDRALLGGCAPATDQRVAIIFICLFKEIIRQFWRIVGVNPLGARTSFALLKSSPRSLSVMSRFLGSNVMRIYAFSTRILPNNPPSCADAGAAAGIRTTLSGRRASRSANIVAEHAP